MRQLALFLLLLAVGCTRSSPVMSAVEQALDGRPAIIVVPGYYGSALRSKSTGRRIFLTGWESIFGDQALSLFQSELGTPLGPELEVEGLLGAVPVIPGVYEVEVYGPLVRRLRALRPDAQVIPFSYDWRDDVGIAAAKLDALVRTLAEKKCNSISVLGHSMGGLVLAYYLAYGATPPETALTNQINWNGAKLVNKAVFVGTPFMGTMLAFRSFEKGSDVVHSNKLLPADAMASFPSLYELLPGNATLLDKAGTERNMDLFDPELWNKNHFGLLRRGTLELSFIEQRAHFTAEWLRKGRKLSELLQMGRTAAWQPPASLKVLNIVGTGRPTLDRGYLDADGKLYFDPKDLKAAGLSGDPLYSNGDGTVTLTSAAVPQALEAATRLVVIEGGNHSTLFLDPLADKEYKAFLESK
jgi:pimeloyl-ACP methyl ester carboxylesterase